MSGLGDDGLEELLQSAHELGSEGDWQGMADLLRGALDLMGDRPEVLCWLGVAESELGMEGVAYERFRRALALEPTDPDLLATIGTGLARFDDPAAEAALRAAATLGPANATARWSYGAYLAREGMLEQAFVELTAALELDPDDPVAHFEHGVARALAGDAGLAADAFADAGRLDPDNGWVRGVFGLALIEDGARLEEAATELMTAAELRPDDTELCILAAVAAAAVEDLDGAERLLHMARMGAVDGIVEAAIQEAEDRIDEGGDASRRLLIDSMAPSAYRARLMERP